MAQTFQVNGFSVAAGATSNPILGSTIEYINVAAVLTLYQAADTTGLLNTFFMNNGQTTITIIPPGSGISVGSTADAVKTNENFVFQFAIPAGEHLVHQVTNPTGGAIKLSALYVIT